MKFQIIFALLLLSGQFTWAQRSLQVVEISKEDYSCTYQERYFNLVGEERIIKESVDFIEPQVTYKGKIRNTNLCVFEELTLHETNYLIIDSTTNKKYSIYGDIYLSYDDSIFASFMLSIEGIEQGIEIWEIKGGILNRIYVLRNEDIILDKFCWGQDNSFYLSYTEGNKKKTIRILIE